MNVLFVVDEFPFPPRNGVTLPVANFIELFNERGHRVDLLLLNLPGSPTAGNGKLSRAVTAFGQVQLERTGRFRGLVQELTARRALFESWSMKGQLSGDGLLTHYDLVWASPIRPYALWLELQYRLGIRADKIMAAINDSYTLTLSELSKRKTIGLERLIYRARARAMRSIEKNRLMKADFIAVQSKREVEFFRELISGVELPAVIEVKNGVASGLLKDRLRAEFDLLFVGSLEGFYRPTLDWFIREVYSKMPIPRPSFVVIGSGATEEDKRKFAELSITYLSFVDDIYRWYLVSKILVAPIFKGYGTINKVIEAMAAGCVVVGDRTAFNGLENFVPNRDGLVADLPGEFMDSILNVLADPCLAEEIGDNARNLMRKDFSWDSRINFVLDRLKLS
ncbi:glycosyltransferase family 4 protein [Cupriavidus pinatubonensis]|uniref:glycosyltransferase family 4 protein n=1 Tax=Cupriavidus pinatubonensis TaxID=248026 RepID=UPI0011267B2B|nr:glycosyltransferase family 4 protein [Cupriavidus pinatubonensis]TPQ39603.1 hypothetical protein C2U69_11710 [Cupriavidus pinatubonensis]